MVRNELVADVTEVPEELLEQVCGGLRGMWMDDAPPPDDPAVSDG